MQGAQQVLGRPGTTARGTLHPRIHGRQVAGDLGVEDLEQQRIDRRRHHLDDGLRGGVCRQRTGLDRPRTIGLDLDLDLGLRRVGDGLDDVGGCFLVHHRRRGQGRHGGNGRGGGLVGHGLVTGGDAVGGSLHALEVGLHRTVTAQRGLQLRQGVERLVDHRDHGRAGHPRAVQHAVEHVLDLPAELAERARAHQAAAALQGVEHAADRPQALQVVGLRAPQRQQLVEVVDLLGEFLEEDFADLVVDLVAGGREAVLSRGRGDGPHRRCRRFVRLRGERRLRVGGPGAAAVDQRRDRALDVRFAHHRRRHRGLGLVLTRRALGRQRPVAQALQAVAADVQDLVAVEAPLAQRLEVVLQARQRVGERVQLAAVGHAPAGDQLVLDVAAHAGQVGGGLRQLEHLQRTGHLAEQARHFGQFGVVPAGLDEGDEGLAGVREVGDRLAREHVQHLVGLACGEIALPGRVLVARAQARDLVVQSGIDVEQRTGDVEQCALVGGLAAVDDVRHRRALLVHHAARDAEAEHAERVGDAAQRLDLRRQPRQIGFGGAQVQVEGVLDPQQVFLDGRGHGVEQRAVAAAHAALGVADLGVGRKLPLQLEGVVQRAQRGVVRARVGGVVEQLAGGLERGLGARHAEAVVLEQPPRFALDAGKRLAQRRGRLQRAIGHGPGHRRRHPQHAPRGLGLDMVEQRPEGGRQRARVGRATGLGPRGHRCAQAGQQGLGARVAHRHRVVGDRGAGHVARQRTLQVGREQHAFRQPRLAARGAQVVEQRQQDDRDVLVAALQALEIVGQQHHAAHQHRAGTVAVGHGAFLQRLGQALHLLGHHRRRIQLDHAQRALHLVQVARAEAHAAGVGGVGGEVLDLDPRLAQGLVELRLDPAERGVVDGVAQCRHGTGIRPAA